MRFKKASSLGFFVAVTTVLLLMISNSATASQNSLAGSQWRLDSFGRGGDEKPVLEGTSISIQFGTDGRVSGSSGCNSYSGTYTSDSDRLSFGQMISTMRACVDAKANQQEQKYMAALRAISRFAMTENKLTVTDGGEIVLNFSSPPASKNSEPVANTPIEMLSEYFAAINEKQFARGFGFWEHSGATLEKFSAGYADTRNVRFVIEPTTRIEGAAGSLFAEVPALIFARSTSGAERLFAGCYVLRKSNMVEPQTGWHIHKASITPVTQTAKLSQQLFRQCNN